VSTPPERGQQGRRPALEPTYVMRRRRTEALADLVREFRESQEQHRDQGREPDPVEDYEPIVVHTAPAIPEPPTERLPPVPGSLGLRSRGEPERPVRRQRQQRHGRNADEGLTLRRAAITLGVTAAVLIGFGAALVLPGSGANTGSRDEAGPPPAPPASSAPPAQRNGTDPDGAGTLREGDSGARVTELQERLLRVPNVYENGSTSGSYDATLTAAVARFQLWYGIRGDETGVYGDDTRRDLESRTTLDASEHTTV
jgi:hypothetical protein